MIYLKHGKNKIEVPQIWAELKLHQWESLRQAGDDQKKIISILTGLTIDVVEHLSMASIIVITEGAKFLSEKFDTKKWVVPEVLKLGEYTVYPKIDIKEKEYGQKVLLTDAVIGKSEVVNNISTILEIYFQTLITKKHYDTELTEEFKNLIDKNICLCDAYAIAMDYEEQLGDLLENEVKTLNKQPSEDQKRAGIDIYNKFGIMNTIRALANGDILKVPEVLKMDYQTVYLWLLMNKADAQFQESYRNVMKNKK